MTRLLIALLLAAGWSTVLYQVGHTHGATEVEALRTQDRTQAMLDLGAANDRVSTAQHQLTEQLSTQDDTHQKELKNAQDDHDRRVAALRAGTVRVSIPVTAAPACHTAAAAAAAGAAPAIESAETRAELTPEAAATLEGIVRDGDSAIIDLNTCIDRYSTVRDTVEQLSQAQR